MNRALQLFSDQYLRESKRLSPTQVVRFIEEYQRIRASQDKPQSTLISLRVESRLLAAFRTPAKLEGIPYQTKIKYLMEEWIKQG